MVTSRHNCPDAYRHLSETSVRLVVSGQPPGPCGNAHPFWPLAAQYQPEARR